MTGRDLVEAVGSRPLLLVASCATPVLIAVLLGLVHGRDAGGRSPWKYVYTLVVYTACVPGIGSTMLTAYALLFTGENLMALNLLVYLLPVVTMVAALLVVSRNVRLDEVPGFDRLSGLMLMLALTFALVLALSKTRIWLVFGGSIFTLMVLVAGIFALLKWGAHLAFRRADEPRRSPPDFPGP